MRLRTFGGLALEDAGLFSAAVPRRSRAVLALLAVAGQRGIGRERVAALLWPESVELHARNSLSQSLSALRRDQLSDSGALVVGTAELRLNPSVVTSDVGDFEASLASDDLERAVDLYQGPFLDGFYLKGASEFERWVDEQRRRLHQKCCRAVERLALRADSTGANSDAVSWWQRFATLEPASSSAAIGLLTALAASGRSAAALQAYEVHEAFLRTQLGVAPDAKVASFAARLRHHINIADSNSAATPNAADPSAAKDRVREPSKTPPDEYAGILNMAAPRASVARMVARWAMIPILCLGAVAFIALRAKDATSYNPRRVVVTGFVNRSGDSTLDAFGFLAADFIVDALQRSAFVEVTDPATSLLAVMQARKAEPLGNDAIQGKLVSGATRAGLIVGGWFSRIGDSIAIVARVSDAANGKVIGTTEEIRSPSAEPRAVLEPIRQRVLGILAVRLDSRVSFVLPPGATSPPTLDAYNEYVDGLLQYNRSEDDSALHHFRRAYALDSTFVAPLIWQEIVLEKRGRSSEWQATINQLGRHRAQLSPLDRFVLESFEAHLRGDIRADAAALEQASRLAPRSIWTYHFGWRLWQMGRYREAVAALEQIDRTYGWTRNSAEFWNFFVTALHYVDHRRELDIAREARRVLPPDAKLLMNEARALASLGRRTESRRILAEMGTLPDPRRCYGNFLRLLGKEFWAQGDTVYGQQLLDSAVAFVRALPSADIDRCGIRWQLAGTLYDAGRWAEACLLFPDVVVKRPQDWEAIAHLGLCHARAGEEARAKEVIARLVAGRDASGDWSLTDAARVAAVLGDRDRVINLLEAFRARGHSAFQPHLQAKDYHGIRGFAAHQNFGGLLGERPTLFSAR